MYGVAPSARRVSASVHFRDTPICVESPTQYRTLADLTPAAPDVDTPAQCCAAIALTITW
jgi:hypothetical protein